MLEKKWKTLSGEKIADMHSHVRANLSSGGKQIHVGSDSQQAGKTTIYSTVLVVITPGKGGMVYYTEERVSRVRELRERLYKEVWHSTELAMELVSTPDIGGTKSIAELSDITIHIDANTEAGNGRFKSNRWAQELAGMAAAQGFKALLKPDAWCASHVADHVVKGKVHNRSGS